MAKPITVIYREISTPLKPVAPWPLMHTVHVPDNWTEDNSDDDAILRQIADIRYDELGCEDNDDGTQSDVIYEIMGGIELLFAFEGDIAPIGDWREC